MAAGGGGASSISSGPNDPTVTPSIIPSIYINTTTRKTFSWATGDTQWKLNTLALDDLIDVSASEQITTFTQVNNVSGGTLPVDFWGLVNRGGTFYYTVSCRISTADAALFRAGTQMSATSTGTPTIFTLREDALATGSAPNEYYLVTTVTNATANPTWGGQTGNISASLFRVTTSTLLDGEVLTWNATTLKWEPRVVPGTQTTNTLASNVNTMVSNVNGAQASAPIVNTVQVASGAALNTLKVVTNGVSSNDFQLPATGVTAIPFDIIQWTNDRGVGFVTNRTIPIQTGISVTTLDPVGKQWTINATAITGFTSPSEILLTDSSGRSLSGIYTSAQGSGGATAVLDDVNWERASNFQPSTTYTGFTARQGQAGLASIYVGSVPGPPLTPVSLITPDSTIASTFWMNRPGNLVSTPRLSKCESMRKSPQRLEARKEHWQHLPI